MDDSEEEFEHKPSKKRGGKLKSGLYQKTGDVKLVSNEWYAHTALDEAILGEKEFKDMSFNLLVVGELEIVMSNKINERIENQTGGTEKTGIQGRVFVTAKHVNAICKLLTKNRKGRIQVGE